MRIHCVWMWLEGWEDLEGRGKGLGGWGPEVAIPPQHTHTHTLTSAMSIPQRASPSLMHISFPRDLHVHHQGCPTPTPAPEPPTQPCPSLPPILPHHPHPTLSQTYLPCSQWIQGDLREKPLMKACVPHRRALSLLQGPGPRGTQLCMACPFSCPTESLALGHRSRSLAPLRARSYEVLG